MISLDLLDTNYVKRKTHAKVISIHSHLHGMITNNKIEYYSLLISFSLAFTDVHPVGDDWDEKAIDFLSQQKEKLLNASVVSVHNRIYKVQLTDPETDTDLAKEMVVNSLALGSSG